MATVLLSRDAERAVLGQLSTETLRSEGSVVVLEGPAGIGKTVLLEHLRDRATADGLRVLGSRASELDRAFGYGVVHQLFEPALAAVTATERADLLTGAAGRAAGLFSGAEATEEQAYAVQLGLYWLAVNLAERQPLLLLVDDLQWADLPSLRFLEYLGRRLDGLPLSVVATVRTSEPEAPTDLLNEIGQGPDARVLRPSPLGPDAVADVLNRSLGVAAEQGFVRAAWQTTGGNPLLLSLLAREAAGLRLAGTDAEGDRLTELGAPGVVPAVQRRLRPLGPDATAVARAAAVVGERGTIDDIQVLAGLPREIVRRALDLLGLAAILVPESWAFVHPLVKAAVLESCPRGTLVGLHRAAVERLRERGARPAEISLHWLAIDAAGDTQAVDDLLRSAAAAAADDAPEAAMTHLRRALAEPPTPAQLPQVLLELGELEVRAQHAEGAPRLRTALTLLPPGNDAARARAALGNSLVHNDPVAALDEVRLGLEQASDPVLKLRLEAFTLEALIFPDAFAAAREAALAAGRADPDPSPVMLAHLALADACAGRPVDGVRQLTVRALADGVLVDAIGPDNSTWNLLTHSVRFAQSPERSRQALEEGEALIVKHGLFAARFFVDQSWGYWQRDFGSVAVGAARSQLSVENVRDLGYGITMPVAAAIAAENLLHLDRAAEAIDELEKPWDSSVGTFMEPFIRTARGYTRFLLGRVDDAEADLRLGVGWEDRREWHAPHITRARMRLAEVLVTKGQRAEALELTDHDLEVATAAGLDGALGMALRVRALALPADEAVDVLRRAVEILSRTAYRLDYGWAQHDLAVRLSRRGDRQGAREPLRLAMDAAARTESTRLARHVRRELEGVGLRPRRSRVFGAEALTAAERRVADLALEGLTNRQIAESLWVTLKTVEVHLSRCYGKLGIASRRELAGALDAAVRG